MSDADYSIHSRGRIRAKVTRTCNKIHDDLPNLTSVERKANITYLESLRVELKNMDEFICSDIWKSKSDKVELEAEWDICDSYEKNIFDTIFALDQPITEVPITSSNSEQVVAHSSRLNKLRLPEIPLPMFSNAQDETLNHFLENFNNILSKYELSDYEKFVYLKRQLKGEPLTLIGSLSGVDQSFEGAKLLLREAFADSVSQKYSAVQRLSQLKLIHGGDPYQFISEMRLVQDLFRTLDITSELVIQYFIWNGMTSGLQTQLINICNSNKPDLASINANIFKALDRFKELDKSSEQSSQRKTKYSKSDDSSRNIEPSLHSYAANVQYDSKSPDQRYRFCTLCSDKRGSKETSHSTKNCSVYKSPQAKIERLRYLNACTRCGYGNHNTDRCSFEFHSKCFYCSKDHMSFLCPSPSQRQAPKQSVPTESKNKDKAKQKSNFISSGVVWAETAYHINVGGNTILPTFQCKIAGTNLRAMKDSGCQAHFLETEIAERLNLRVICNDYTVTIHGFNQGMNYNTKVVSVPLEICGKIHNLQAICIPSIKTNLKLPGLRNIAGSFVDRGYSLADPALTESDSISDLNFILGMYNPEVLLEEQISFGKPLLSVFSQTRAGVMLYGNVELFQTNIAYLPDVGRPAVNLPSAPTPVPFMSRDLVSEHPKICSSGNDRNISPVNSHTVMLSSKGSVDDDILQKAVDEVLQKQCNYSLGYDEEEYNEDSTDINDDIVKYVLDNTTRKDTGRLVVPLTWRGSVAQFLGKNFKISKVILNSMKKLDGGKLGMIQDSIQEWKDTGIIEQIQDLPKWLQDNPHHSFLPHMGVFRMSRETTKCRVVFLSNICEKSNSGVVSMSHNQVIHPGPSLNPKITTALMHQRFGEKLLCYDLAKAFLQLSLYEADSNKLLFLWFKDVKKRDFSIVAYRNLRLSFGLRCSPTILMLALYKILCLDVGEDAPELVNIKKQLYALLYMDNGAYTGTSVEVRKLYRMLSSIFNPYCFSIQQVATNDIELQREIDSIQESETSKIVKLLGLDWNREEDRLSPRKICLNDKANTKRLILQSIASQYDTFNIQGPCLNRARLFMHSLQVKKDLNWDTRLEADLIKQWHNIVKQANRTPPPSISRNVGSREDSYELIGFSDASKDIYACVLYLRNETTKQVSFLIAKNRIVNRQLELKTIPTLELQAISLGVEMLSDAHKELSGPSCVLPIKINKHILFTDSSISLHWLNSQAVTFDKMQKRSIFVRNRLDYIERQCNKFPITFNFVSTHCNPADCLSRCLSYTQLQKSCYFEGPEFLRSEEEYLPEFSVKIPSPLVSSQLECTDFHAGISEEISCVINLKDFSSLERAISAVSATLRCLDIWKSKLSSRPISRVPRAETNYRLEAWNYLLRKDQLLHFSEVIDFLNSNKKKHKDIPPLVSQLNLFVDDRDNVVKMKSKFDRWKTDVNYCFPSLLSNSSFLTDLLIVDVHKKLAHAGCYTVLSHIKQRFWFSRAFSKVKSVLRSCVVCRRFNARPIKLNQNSYRPFRAEPDSIPYRFIFLDYLGPFKVDRGNIKSKVWLLCITCLWSRAVNLLICPDLTLKSFLRALQIHVYQEGLPALIFSDLGSQIVAGAKIVKEYLNDPETLRYLNNNGIERFQFDHYFKGNSSMGSLVEICVKFVKRLIYGSVRNNVLLYDDLCLIVHHTVHICNKRPIAFKEALRDDKNSELPSVLSPEILCKGRELVSLNIVPALQPDPENDREWSSNMGSSDQLRKQFDKARKVRMNLIKTYDTEFKKSLIDQAVASKDKFKPIRHDLLKVNDIVLLTDPLLKANHYPMAVVTSTIQNSLGEVTNVIVRKGSTREFLKRHVSSVMFLMRPDHDDDSEIKVNDNNCQTSPPVAACPKRVAAVTSRQRTMNLLGQNLV